VFLTIAFSAEPARNTGVICFLSIQKGQREMNKGELVASIAKAGVMTKVQAELALNKVLANMTDAMEKGDRVTLVGFGSFRVVERAAQKGRNPQTGQAIVIPAHNVVKFKPGKKLYDRVR
jgi:DNA-binding protein HU-beta